MSAFELDPPLDPRLRQRLVEPTPARDWVLATLTAASERPRHATHSFRQAARDARKLRSRERRALWDLVYDLVRYRAVLGRIAATPDWEGLLDAWLSGGPVPEGLPDADRLGCTADAAADLRSTYGDALEDWLAASNARAPTTLRAHVGRIGQEALQGRLRRDGIETIPVGAAGLNVVGRANVLGSAAWREGLFEVQDLASQWVSERVDPAGHTVLDLCAGAGGKALAMAALGGRVTATDIRARALEELRNRAQRARSAIEVHLLEGDPLGSRTFERVLVDAPCSGTGVWRRHPELRWRLGEAGAAQSPTLADLHRDQRMLVETGARHVAEGGRLVYATCSALRSENEALVDGFLADHPEWARAEPDLRTAPHVDGTDGMYAAFLERR
ncbi:MAG: RsmB/NOP family class I SAM-dependent RNA methyltransferase [Myxococcota bacterium]